VSNQEEKEKEKEREVKETEAYKVYENIMNRH